jgi:hypothetical protein
MIFILISIFICPFINNVFDAPNMLRLIIHGFTHHHRFFLLFIFF